MPLLLAAARLAAVAAAGAGALLLAGVVVLVALHACVVGKAFLRYCSIVEGRRAASLGGLSPEELRELPCYEFDVQAGGGDDDCAVCLEGFGAGDRCRRLPACGHSFHARCVDRWLLAAAPVCPTCRTSAASTPTHRRSVVKYQSR